MEDGSQVNPLLLAPALCVVSVVVVLLEASLLALSVPPTVGRDVVGSE